jgi:hypothetical protein
LLEFTGSKSLAESPNDDGFESSGGRGTVEREEEWVVAAIAVGQIGKPPGPDTSALLFDLGHAPGLSGKLRKMENAQEMISSGRGASRKPAGICVGK